MTCPHRGWRAPCANWPRSGIPGTPSAAGCRSNTGCSPTRRAGRRHRHIPREHAGFHGVQRGLSKIRKEIGAERARIGRGPGNDHQNADRGAARHAGRRMGHLAEGPGHRGPGRGWRPAAADPVRSAELRGDHPPGLSRGAAGVLPEPGRWPYPGGEAGEACWPLPRRTWRKSGHRRRRAGWKDPDKIGIRVGKVIGKHKVGKHFTWQITDGGFSFRRDEEKIAAEAALTGST